MARVLSHMDWRNGTVRCEMALTGHTHTVSCVAQLSDGRIVSGCNERSLRVWDVSTGECVRQLTGHTAWVSCVTQLSDGLIVSGSGDSSLRVWDVETGE